MTKRVGAYVHAKLLKMTGSMNIVGVSMLVCLPVYAQKTNECDVLMAQYVG